MRAVLVATFPLASLLACAPTTGDPAGDHPCQLENHCVRDDGELRCEDGYEWEDPDDEDNYNCVSAGGEGEGEGGVVEWGLPSGGHPTQGYYDVAGAGGNGSDKWSLFDIDGDERPDIVITAKTSSSGDYVQLGFPSDGHWLVHKNDGQSGFQRSGVKFTLPSGGHPTQGYYDVAGAGGNGSDKWSLFDIDGDGLPDIVITAKTSSSGEYVQLGFPSDGHWLVHKNTGSGFERTGVKHRLPAGGHPTQGYYDVAGAGGNGSDKWSLVDMDGDGRPDLVVTAKTSSSGEYVQLGFPSDGHWRVHFNTGAGFAR